MTLSSITYNPYVKFIDLYLSKILQNPIITCGSIIVLFFSIQFTQISEMFQRDQFNFIFTDDYFMDIISCALNILFIIRFCTKYYTNIFIEILFLGIQNASYYYLLTSEYSLLKEDSQFITKFIIFFQIACSYTILLSNLFDVYYRDNKLLDAMKNSNNNFMPLLLIQSFLLVNITFPFYNNDLIVMIYLALQFSIKIYCIYQYALYEIALVFYSLAYVPDYSCFYNFEIKNKSKSWFQRLSNYNSYILIATNLIIVSGNIIFLILSYY